MQSLYIFPENKTKAKTLMEDIINDCGKKLATPEVYQDMFYGNNTESVKLRNILVCG